ncbi:MAG TPA: lactonase family protein [Verrucomicrobiae bacterium]
MKPVQAVVLALAGILSHSSPMVAQAANPSLVYIGTYTGARSQGIYAARFDATSGKLSAPELAAEAKNPTFLAVSPNGRFLYAANEIGNFAGGTSGGISAYRIEKETGKLTLLNQQPSGGSGPCHVEVDKRGNCVLAANYGSGSVAVFKVAADGRLAGPGFQVQHRGSSVNPQRQQGPHAHHITCDAANRFVLACDLGLDQVLLYRFDSRQATLNANNPPSIALAPGAGPRHLAFHPNGRWVYVINELNSTLSAFEYAPRSGTLTALSTVSTLPEGFAGRNSCAEVAVHPSGKYVYGSNRGDDSIALFAIDPKTGRASFVARESTRGKTPRHFALDPAGKWLLAENQDSNDIFVFRVDAGSGRLEPVGGRVEVGAPVCLVFVR